MIQGFAFQVNNFAANQSKTNLRNNKISSKNNFNEILDNKSKSREAVNDKDRSQSKNDEIIRQQGSQINNRRAEVKNEQIENKPKEESKKNDVKQEDTIVSKEEKTIEELIENLSELLVVFQNVIGINVNDLENISLEDLNLEISLEELENLKSSLQDILQTLDLGDLEQEIEDTIVNIGKMIQDVNKNGEMEVSAEKFIVELKEVLDAVNSKADKSSEKGLSDEVEKTSNQLQHLIKTMENSKEKPTDTGLFEKQPTDHPDVKIKVVSEKKEGINLLDLLDEFEELDISTIADVDLNTEKIPINILSNNTTQVKPEDIVKTVNDATLNMEQFIDIDKSDVLKQITSKVKTDYESQLNEIKINLTPEHLGALTIKVSLERGILSARAFVENSNIKQLLESNIDELKNSLKEQGVELGSIDVSVGSDSDSEARNSNFFMNHKRVKGLKTNIENTVDMTQYEDLSENSQSSSMEVGEGGMDITV